MLFANQFLMHAYSVLAHVACFNLTLAHAFMVRCRCCRPLTHEISSDTTYLRSSNPPENRMGYCTYGRQQRGLTTADEPGTLKTLPYV